jgi:hypothetical protein
VRRAALGAVALGVGLSLAGCASHRLVRHGRVDDDVLGGIRASLAALRGLDFTASVPATAESRDEIAATVRAEVEQSFAPGELEWAQAVDVRLGLLPAGSDLRRALERLYEEEGAGFYDPRTKRLILAERALGAGGVKLGLVGFLTGRDLVGEFLVAHELTHALQDQHWGLPTKPEPLLDQHGDRELARRALLEGDATLAGFAYLTGRPLPPAMIDAIEKQLHGVPAELARKYPDVPEVVRASLAFQYDEGTAFAGRALRSGGWPAVDAVHAEPPASTEQVLHPDRYFVRRDAPVPVAVRGTGALEAAGWTPVLEDTIGELAIRVLAGRSLPAERAAVVADGWGGDRLRAFARGGDVAIVWMTVWDSATDAGEFADAMREIHRDAIVEARDARVLVLLGAPGDVARPVWTAASR